MTETSAIPGQLLGPSSKYRAGSGTHIHNGQVISSLLGAVTITAPKGPQTSGQPSTAKRLTRIQSALASAEKPVISVSRPAGGGRKRETLPDVGNTVLCRVVRLMPRQAIVSIQQVGETVLQTEWQGVIRSQDVRATEKDKVKIYESFRPGDVVKALVVSNFLLSFHETEDPLLPKYSTDIL
jgi:exosome complex component CSL4